jgi:hypothetical protein
MVFAAPEIYPPFPVTGGATAYVSPADSTAPRFTGREIGARWSDGRDLGPENYHATLKLRFGAPFPGHGWRWV